MEFTNNQNRVVLNQEQRYFTNINRYPSTSTNRTLNGRKVEKDQQKSLDLKQLTKQSWYDLAICYSSKGALYNIKTALYYYEMAAVEGNLKAQKYLAEFYHNQEDGHCDILKSAEFYELAANQGDNEAQLMTGHLNEFGIACSYGLLRDLEKAVKFYRLAADQGNVMAQIRLAGCYLNGRGVPKDLKKANELYQLAVNQGERSDPLFKLGKNIMNELDNEENSV